MLNNYFELKQIIKTLSIKRLWNLILLYKSYLLSLIIKKPFVWAYPFAITIEPTTMCNLFCEECPTGKKTLTRSTGKIELSLFENIIEQVYKKTFYLNLYLQGEPFIHPEIIEMIKYAVNKKMFVCISTNGHFLNSETCSEIVKSGIQKIIVSLDGATEETYLKYRKGGDFTKIKNGIKELSVCKNQLNSNTPEIVLQMLVNKYNENEISLVQKLKENLGANKLELKTMQIYFDYNFLPNTIIFKRYIKDSDGKFVLNKKLRNHCYRIWSNAVFTFDGYIIPCCFDKNAEQKFGNINNDTFNKLWRSINFNKFRLSILKDRKKYEICRNCTE